MEDSVAPLLLHWYGRHARSLPWRVPPGGEAPEPYRVWLSEIMLQQTTTAHAAPYFARFTARWPTVAELAAAPEDAVMAAWAGLGYYSRARNLIACARAVVAHGGFPRTEDELRSLPGVGAYTAAAVAAIAFGQRAVVVDANVERVIARLFAIDQPLPAARPAIRVRAASVTPPERTGDFAQAMMDLGATVCTPRQPKCLVCPLSAVCSARRQRRQEELPVKPARKARPVRTGTAFWIARDGQVWLVTRPGTGLLGGMRALPDDGWSAAAPGHGAAPLSGPWRSAGIMHHLFTHFQLELAVSVHDGPVTALADGEWWPVADLAAAGLPTVFAKAARLALARGTG